MTSVRSEQVLACQQFEHAYPLAFPWTQPDLEDVPRFLKGSDGWWYNPAAQNSGKALLCCAGDLMCEPRLTRANRYGDSYFFQPMFQYVRSIFKGADFAVANLETTLTDMTPYAGTYHGVARKYHCNGPQIYLEALRYAGFDALVNANNHNCDAGAAGLMDTNRAVDANGFMRTGTFLPEETQRAILVNVNGIRLGVLSYATTFNKLDANFTPEGKETLLNEFSPEKAARDVAWARERGAEYVISYIHWGKSYVHQPDELQYEQAQGLADAGVDYIVGSHSHCLQIYDKITAADGKTVPVIFSMGNFVTNESQDLCRHCGILQLQLEKAGGGIRVQETFMPCLVMDTFGTGRYCCVPVDTAHNGGWDHPELYRSRRFAMDIVKGLPEPVTGAVTVAELCALWNIPLPEGMEYRAFSKISLQCRQPEDRMLYFSLGNETDFDLRQLKRREMLVVVTETPLEGVCCLVVPDVKQAYRQLAEMLRSRFTAKFVAVAGGSGKTAAKEQIVRALRSGFRVLTHPDGLKIDTCAWRMLRPGEEFFVQELRPDHPLGMAEVSTLLKPDICVITGDMENPAAVAAGLAQGGVLLYNENDSRLGEKMAGLTLPGIRVQPYGAVSVPGLRMEQTAGAAVAVAAEAGISRQQAVQALESSPYPGYEQNCFSVEGMTVLTDYACKCPEAAKASLEMLMQQPGKKIAVVENVYAELARHLGADTVIAREEPPAELPEQFAAQQLLEKELVDALTPSCAVLLCGGRHMDFNVTLRRVFGITDGEIRNGW